MTDLLDAVDRLTIAQHLPVVQDVMLTVTTDDGNITRASGKTEKKFVTLDPLLTQLEEAIRSSIGGNAAGASLAHERSILDTVALYEAMKISAMIGDWCRLVSIRPTKNMTTDLRAWYAARLPQNPTYDQDRFYLRELGKWERFITGKLEPWRERELPNDCPTCGAKEWWRDGERYFHPLIVRYKPDGPDLVQQARAMCRSCEQVWGVRELAFAIEQAGTVDA